MTRSVLRDTIKHSSCTFSY